MGGGSTNFSSSRYDYNPSPSVTRKSAADYAKADERSYVMPPSGLPFIAGKDFETTSQYTLAIILDQTGSMSDIPKVFIQKAATLYAEANAAIQGVSLKELESGKKLEDLLDMAVVAIGDARNRESYPFQALNYAHGDALIKGIQAIYPEGNGGGNLKESYDLGAYYFLNHCKTPNVPAGTKPLLIILGDEGFYPTISAGEVKIYIGSDPKSDIDTKTVLKGLNDKFDTYVLRPEMGNYDASRYATVQADWEDIFGAQRVLRMNGYSRAVDAIIAICGYASGNFKVAEDLLKRRQTPEQVQDVLNTMHPLLSSLKTAVPVVSTTAAKARRNRKPKSI